MQDMYTFFPPLTVLPHGKVLYLYPADRAAALIWGRTLPPNVPHHLTSRTSPPTAPHSHTGAALPRKLSAPAYRLHMGPPCGRRGTKYRGMISYFLWWKFSK